MNHKTLSLLSAAAALSLACSTARTPVLPDPVDCVNPLCGTASTYHLSTGNTYPAVALPWGTHFWTPQTGRNGDGWTYTYSATRIRGFKQTHQPSPWINDYGAFSIMPVTTGPFMDEERRQSWFSHKAETATPYYYKVYLAEHDVVAELAPTERAAAFRFTYPERDTSYLVVDAYSGGQVQVDMERNVISGCSTANHGGVADGFGNWFVIESDTPFCMQEVEGSIAMVGFRTVRGQEVCLRVASSFISPEQAVTNLGELGGRTIDEVAGDGRSRWNEVLGRIKAEDDDIDNLRTFYSCLYRSLLFPRDLSEVDASGERIHRSPYDGGIHKGYLFGDTGFWDTFRCLFPLLDLVYPDQEAKMQEGLVNTWLESGFLPEWASPGHRGCMVGNNSASVVAGAYVKGIRGHDAEQLWKAVTHGAHAVHPSVSSTGRLGWEYYDSLGYVPCDVGIRESAARTLEYSYDDWCIYTFGKALGKSEEELAPYAKAALNYRNLFDPAYGLMAGRKADGEFARPFSPLKWGGDFTEGNSLHYTWSVFHDPDGLVELMGGEEGFTAKLDSIFTIPPLYDDSYYGGTIHEIREMQVMNMGNYAHGNQPIQHMLYLYDWGGQPWKAQQRIREVMDKFYNSNFDGYCGDEDNADIRQYIADSFCDDFRIIEATNGEEGVQMAQEQIPDIIVSDIMMPEMNGIQLTRMLKGDIRTSHIPIILLTAKDSDEDKEDGYDSGADSYITKPFTAKLLASRIKNLLTARRRLAEYISNRSIEPEKVVEEPMQTINVAQLSRLDQEFLDKLNNIITGNIMNQDIDLPFVTDKMAMSHSTFYRKVKALTGMTAKEYIRKFRLQHCYKLLESGDYNVTEAAMMTGFNQMSHFRETFKKEFGILPSEVKKKNS